jgi:hypothetical protein
MSTGTVTGSDLPSVGFDPSKSPFMTVTPGIINQPNPNQDPSEGLSGDGFLAAYFGGGTGQVNGGPNSPAGQAAANGDPNSVGGQIGISALGMLGGMAVPGFGLAVALANPNSMMNQAISAVFGEAPDDTSSSSESASSPTGDIGTDAGPAPAGTTSIGPNGEESTTQGQSDTAQATQSGGGAAAAVSQGHAPGVGQGPGGATSVGTSGAGGGSAGSGKGGQGGGGAGPGSSGGTSSVGVGGGSSTGGSGIGGQGGASW